MTTRAARRSDARRADQHPPGPGPQAQPRPWSGGPARPLKNHYKVNLQIVWYPQVTYDLGGFYVGFG